MSSSFFLADICLTPFPVKFSCISHPRGDALLVVSNQLRPEINKYRDKRFVRLLLDAEKQTQGFKNILSRECGCTSDCWTNKFRVWPDHTSIHIVLYLLFLFVAILRGFPALESAVACTFCLTFFGFLASLLLRFLLPLDIDFPF